MNDENKRNAIAVFLFIVAVALTLVLMAFIDSVFDGVAP